MSDEKQTKKVKAVELVEPILRLKALEILYMKKFAVLVQEGRTYLRERIKFWGNIVMSDVQIIGQDDMQHIVQLEDDLFKKFEVGESGGVDDDAIDFLRERISFWESKP